MRVFLKSIGKDDDDEDEDENESQIDEDEIHEYYIPSGDGPILEDLFAPKGSLRSRIELIGTG